MVAHSEVIDVITPLQPPDYNPRPQTKHLLSRFPSRVGSNERPSVPLSQLVRKLSEVEGIMPANFVTAAVNNSSNLDSVEDEGVDISDPPHHHAAAASAASVQHQQTAANVATGSETALSDAGSLSAQGRRARLSQLASFDSASLGSCSSAAIGQQGATGGENVGGKPWR